MKMVIILRKDLNMRKGKMVAQGAHAVEDLITHLHSKYVTPDEMENYARWLRHGRAKIVVGVQSEQELDQIYHQAREVSIPASIITDAGHTEFHGIPTKTAVAIGPSPDEWIDAITGSLPLL
jgi:PTH2 family peptidyl-tRNA hydrolase